MSDALEIAMATIGMTVALITAVMIIIMIRGIYGSNFTRRYWKRNIAPCDVLVKEEKVCKYVWQGTDPADDPFALVKKLKAKVLEVRTNRKGDVWVELEESQGSRTADVDALIHSGWKPDQETALRWTRK